MIITRAAINSKFSIQSCKPGACSQLIPRSFASQTLLSRTDYQNKSTNELREELNKRGILTRSKKRSILIDKLMDFKPRGMNISVSNQKEKVGNSKNIMEKATNEIRGGSESSKSIDQSTPIVCSPSKTVARLMNEPDGVNPKPTAIQTDSNSAALGSPLVTMKSKGHEAKTWPASVNLPSTPVEETLATVIPFIPDNWSSHQQSHAPQLVDIKPNPADLQVSTASHPSTLPGGGPSLIATNEFSSNSDSALISEASESVKQNQVNPEEIISTMISSISIKPSFLILSNLFDQEILNNNDNKSSKLSPQSSPFQFEDRTLNDDEKTGLFKLIAFFGGSCLLVRFFDH